jgi:spermidine/putrescine-binding protein
MSQGKNAKLAVEFKGSLSDILADMAASMEKRNLTPRSAMAADLVTVGDSWLATAVQGGLIEPIKNAEQFEWFQRLDSKWKTLLRRDAEGMIDPQGPIWGVPYRWGSFLIAYRRDKLERNGIPPIKDWKDLFRPELAGKVAMVDSPREVVGAVLKSLGASYNTKDFDKEVPGGREAVKERFHALQKQVRLFDDVEYMKAMSAGDVWVAVGWSSDVFPFAKRALNVTVIAPESGTSLWADLWSIPATTSIRSEKVGGRVRGPSPLAFQWLDFCLQPARAETFKKKDVFVGASPLYLSQGESGREIPVTDTQISSQNQHEDEIVAQGAGVATTGTEVKLEANNNHGGNIETNIVDGMPPIDIVAKSEFLEPLSEKAIEDYHWLLSHPVEVQGWPNGLVGLMKQFFQSCSQWARTRAIRS